LTELVETILTLGGCEVLEQRLQNHSANPSTPQEDTENKYLWQMIHKDMIHTVTIPEDLKRAGYTFVSITEQKHGCTLMNQYYFRKQKGPPYDSDN